DCETTSEQPRYAALLEKTENFWRAVPFSRFPVPATPGEIATGREDIPLKVLCPWNLCLINSHRLVGGWVVDHLSPEEKNLLNIALALTPDQHPPAALKGRHGPRLTHPFDPRHEYIDQERLLWMQLRDAPVSDTIPLAA